MDLNILNMILQHQNHCLFHRPLVDIPAP
jgi:hypothetical protein